MISAPLVLLQVALRGLCEDLGIPFQAAMLKLIDAASFGDCLALNDLLQEDPKILERIPHVGCLEMPLHLASMFGHVQFVQKILGVVNSSLSVKQLNLLNHDGLSPLHLAVANGHLDIVTTLLEFDSIVEDLCMNKDRDGNIPLHAAAARGDIEVIHALVAACPKSTFESTVQEETILHLAVKYNQCEAFMFLVRQINFGDVLNSPDREGNTVFHLAAARKQFQIIEYLISQTFLKTNAVNSYGLTALDVLIMCSSNSIEVKIAEMIRYAGGQRSLNQKQPQPSIGISALRQLQTNNIRSDSQGTPNDNMPGSNGILVMASLIATSTFEIALNPPGGLWQDWDPKSNNTTATSLADSASHRPGQAIFFDLYRDQYERLMIFSGLVFMISISIMVATISRKTVKIELSRLFMARLGTLLLVIMFMMLYSKTTTITTRGNSLGDPGTIIGWLFWLALNVWLAFSPLIAAIRKMLMKETVP